MHPDPTPAPVEALEATETTDATEATEATEATAALPVLYCPECGMPAWVEWRDAVGSTSGAVVHVKVRCFARHWFLLPEDRLTTD